LASVEADFLEKEDLSQYQGEWIAILDTKVVAHAKTLQEIHNIIKTEKIIRTPLLQRIPTKGETDTFVL